MHISLKIDLIDKSMVHPLNGEYIAYGYREQDSVGEGHALAIFRLEETVMNEIYHPRNHVWEANSIGSRQDMEAVATLQRLNVNRVYSVFHSKKFFGIPADWFSMEGRKKPAGKEVNEWAEYEQLCIDDDKAELLTSNGIEVLFWDEDSHKQI